MCLAVPARIVETDGSNATVELNGIRRAASVAFIENPKAGDYVLLHAGFAIEKWSEKDVEEYRQIMSEIAALDGPDPGQ